jgi:hypothetical protein
MFFPSFLFLILFIVNQTNANRNAASSLTKTCTVKHGEESLKEGDGIMIDTKLYKVEGCRLQRAYHVCSTDLWFVVNFVCEAIELYKPKKSSLHRLRRFSQEKLLSEACCQSTCTVHEMTRYCP